MHHIHPLSHNGHFQCRLLLLLSFHVCGSAAVAEQAALLSAVATAALSISDRGSTASSAAVGNAWLWTLSLTSALSGLAFSLLTEMYEPQRQQGAVLPQHSHILAKRLINFSGFAALCGLVPLSSLFSGRLAAMVTVLLVLHVVVFMANVRAMQAAVSSFQNQQAQQLEEQGK
jgi:hypothetical protein